MAKINLLNWRDELRAKRKRLFLYGCAVAATLGLFTVGGTWFYYDQRLQDQDQANQLVQSSNLILDTQLKSLDGLEAQSNAIVERMKLIQGLQGQRPVPVRLLDEMVRIVPANMYLTRMSRKGDQFTIEGKAESPNIVAELLRNMEASPWYRNAFMNSFLALDQTQVKSTGSLVPRIEESYGSFVITADLENVTIPEDASVAEGAPQAAATTTTGAVQ